MNININTISSRYDAASRCGATPSTRHPPEIARLIGSSHCVAPLADTAGTLLLASSRAPSPDAGSQVRNGESSQSYHVNLISRCATARVRWWSGYSACTSLSRTPPPRARRHSLSPRELLAALTVESSSCCKSLPPMQVATSDPEPLIRGRAAPADVTYSNAPGTDLWPPSLSAHLPAQSPPTLGSPLPLPLLACCLATPYRAQAIAGRRIPAGRTRYHGHFELLWRLHEAGAQLNVAHWP